MTEPDGGFLLPWEAVESPSPEGVSGMLSREIAPGHVLEGKKVRMIARRVDTDDVLYEVMTNPPSYAVVHLTWSEQRQTNPLFPWTTMFESMDRFREQMLRDVKDYES